MNEYMRMADRMCNLENQMQKLEKENAELKKRLSDIKLLCYRDGSDGEVLSEIMKYFTKE